MPVEGVQPCLIEPDDVKMFYFVSDNSPSIFGGNDWTLAESTFSVFGCVCVYVGVVVLRVVVVVVMVVMEVLVEAVRVVVVKVVAVVVMIVGVVVLMVVEVVLLVVGVERNVLMA